MKFFYKSDHAIFFPKLKGYRYNHLRTGKMPSAKALKNYSKDFVETCSRWKRLIMVNSIQANEAPQERMSTAWR